MTASIRLAAESDAEPMLAIYAPIVRDTPISFELVPPGADEFRARIRDVLLVAPWLVCEDGGLVVGYAYARPFRDRPAYRFTMETTVYVHADHRGRGVGTALYAALLDVLAVQGFRRVVGGITLPNAASVALHEASGFRHVGVFHDVGVKFHRRHGVGFWEREIAPPLDDPPEPRPLAEVVATAAWRDALVRAAGVVRSD